MPRLPTTSDFPPSLQLDILPPPTTNPPINILILLHGLGDTKTPFTTLGRSLNLPETCCISLQGLNPIPSLFLGLDDESGLDDEELGSGTGAFHWGDDVLVDEVKGEIDMDSGFEMVGKVLGNVVRGVLIGKCGFTERNILFYGFGQGGMVALYLASLSSLEFGGIISIGGRLPSTSTTTTSKAKTPVLICGGSRSTQVTRQAIDTLKTRFENVEYVKWEKREDSMPGSREEMLPLMRFFARRLRSRVGVPEGAVEV